MKYRKKPVIVEAYQTDKEMIIPTLEGDMKASVGDYIITGVNGEQYPCKPDIFKKTYDLVESESSETITNFDISVQNDRENMILIYADHMSRNLDCSDCPISDFCNTHDGYCFAVWIDWLKHEVAKDDR